MADDAWYYAAAGSRQGPVTREQMHGLILARMVDDDTLVWAHGMAEWQPLGRTALAALLPPVAGPQAAGGWSVGSGRLRQAYPAGPPPMGLWAAVASGFGHYATFSGRARPAEYWFFQLFTLGGAILLCGVGLGLAIGTRSGFGGGLGGILVIASYVLMAASLIPMIAVTVRRLHDTDRSGWFYWIQLVPAAGWIVLLIFVCERGTPGPNRYGPPVI